MLADNDYEPDRVRANTAPEINQSIDRKIEENVRYYSGQPKEKMARRIRELDEEWDIERVLQTMASSLSLTGIMLGAAMIAGGSCCPLSSCRSFCCMPFKVGVRQFLCCVV